MDSKGDKVPARLRRKSKLKRAAPQLLEFIAGVMFSNLASILFSTGNSSLGILSTLGSIVAFLALLANSQAKIWGKRIWRWYWSATAVFTVGFVIWALVIALGPKPHLLLYAITSAGRPDTVFFTNSFLKPLKAGPGSKVPTVSPLLVVPVGKGMTNVDLRFGLINDSAPQYANVDDARLVVESPHISLLVLPGNAPLPALLILPHADWQRGTLLGDTNRLTLTYSRMPSLLPGLGHATPPIALDATQLPRNSITVIVRFRGKGVPETILHFSVILVPTATNSPPQLFPEGSGVMVMKLRPQAHGADH